MFFSFLAAGLAVLGPVDTIRTATVTADRGMVVSKTDTVVVSNSLSVTDVLHQIPGLYLGDYGGFAGLKTVSLRGMGSAHTAIYIDGVRVSNSMSGQADLGFLGIENCAVAAVDYAQNSISFNSARPEFNGRRAGGFVKFKAGSFGTFLPSAKLDFKINDRLSLSANAAGILSKGNFPLEDGSIRANNDISQFKGGLDLFGLMDSGRWQAKAFYNGAERGTPGSVSRPSEDRQTDRNAYLQATLSNRFGSVYTLDASAKAAYDFIGYKSAWGDSDYTQFEAQLNSAHRFNVSELLTLSLSADGIWNGLESTMYDGDRFVADVSAAAALRAGKFRADLALEYNGTFDKGAAAGEQRSITSNNSISPSLQLRWEAVDGLELAAFGRRGYRVPSFNELYYPGYGNKDLRPEDAWMTDAGISFRKAVKGGWRLKASADVFYNYVTDKIVSAPTDASMMVWLPFNVGKSRAIGVDADLRAYYENNGWKGSFGAHYVWQDATDLADDTQLLYIARNSVSADASVGWKGFETSCTWTFKAGRTDSAGAMPDWNSFDLNLGKNFKLPSKMSLALRLHIRNLFNKRYEIVAGYPMQGRNITGGIEFRF